MAVARALRALLAGLFAYVFVRNSWVGDDAYIIFRSVDNLFHGYGLRWNVAERVQTFTCPLWTLMVSALHAVGGDFYYGVLGLSFALCAAALVLAWRRLRDDGFLLLMLLLLSSKAFVDFTSSGLETPLSYLLAVVFFLEFLSAQAAPPTARGLRYPVLVAALAFTSRPDTALLYVLPLAFLVGKASRDGWARVARAVALGALPALAWEAFSLVYYGFLWPNSYYAKLDLGIPAATLLRQGARYLANSFGFDPVTLATLGIAVVAAVASRRARPIVAAASALLYALYAVWIGGDFMSGRFFALPFLVAALLLATQARSRTKTLLLAAAVVAYNVVAPWVPVKTDARKPWNHPYTIAQNIYDEAGGYRRGTNLLLYAPFSGDRPAATFPKHRQYQEWARWGALLGAEGRRAGMPLRGGVGFMGFFAGPAPYIIDAFAVTDPFLARLPVPEDAKRDYAPGHILRTIPAGYVESVLAGENRIADPELRAYYGKLSLITRGRLWDPERWRHIVEFNFGGGKKFGRAPAPDANLPREGFLSWR
jgi:arabinofuranosyltransferase